ncbi:hypothetical protein JKP88DRAFT_277124 [Tribonema minus]|uniref:Uncharacterized protein n=1 Tax=Tribonema minus TaxID=303371 RepID=A0A835YZS0_9STRA|nr:hypothetical protein JKP88DRAFT_277124 [Tribonema minus]
MAGHMRSGRAQRHATKEGGGMPQERRKGRAPRFARASLSAAAAVAVPWVVKACRVTEDCAHVLRGRGAAIQGDAASSALTPRSVPPRSAGAAPPRASNGSDARRRAAAAAGTVAPLTAPSARAHDAAADRGAGDAAPARLALLSKGPNERPLLRAERGR